jgi:DNA ligase D-like protein (predicted polymerase)
MPGSESAEIVAAGRTLVLSNPQKTFFAERGETKLDLAHYYLAVERPLMGALGGRPVLMERYPDGAGGPSFFQKRVPKNAPDWLQTTTVQTPNGTPSQALVAADVAHIVWAVNLGCIGLHVWPYLADDPENADQLRIDLDPSPGVDLAMVKEAAAETRSLLAELGMAGYPKTTGRNGIHIYLRVLPEQDSIVVRQAAVALARELERRRPDLVTAAWWKEERGARVFVDFNQNAPHKTVIGAWTVRPRVGGQVSTPFAWDELDAIEPETLTIATVPGRVATAGDPWQQMQSQPQSLEPLLELHRRDMAAGLMDAPWPPVYPKMPNEPARVAPSRARSRTSRSTDAGGR